MLVDGELVVFSGIEIKDGDPILFIGKNGKKKSGEHIVIDAHGVTEAMLKAVISYHIETKGAPPVGFPGNLTDDNRKNFRKEFDKHRARDHNGTMDDWAQSAIRDISFGKAMQKLGYGVFEIELLGFVNVGDFKNVPKEINVIARRY
ncbi:hypothetical protein LJR118_003070 [Acidovorax sp. LjRoot118]|uniref:hypothetical protein n=1 Tax=Acidovorax sp. LjRoot118 TaxID=3342256 RepID=UPI003ED0574A